MNLLTHKIKFDEIQTWDRLVVACSSIKIKPLFNYTEISPNNLNNKKIIVSGGGDTTLTKQLFNISDNKTIWFSQNVDFIHNKLRCFPIGLPDYSHDSIIGNLNVFYEKLYEDKKNKNLVFLGIRTSTFPNERNYVFDLFKNTSFTTNTTYDRTKNGYSKYIDNIRNHKFVLCPRGNGIDTHRLWESLYLGSIPIVKNCITTSFWKNLPILFVDSWEEALNVDYLEEQYDILMNKYCDFKELNLSYWIGEFKKYL